jgi:hypothetical protein
VWAVWVVWPLWVGRALWVEWGLGVYKGRSRGEDTGKSEDVRDDRVD